MNKRTFWIYVSISLGLACLLAYRDAKQKIIQLLSLQQTEKRLIQKINFQHEQVHQAQPDPLVLDVQALKSTDVLLKMVRIVEDHGFSVQVLQPEKLQGRSNILPVTMIIVGQVGRFTKLLMDLAQHDVGVGFQHFSLTMDEHGVTTFKIKAYLLCQYLKSSSSYQKAVENKPISYDFILATPIEQLTYAGYLHDSEEFWGLIMTPSGQTQAVKIGSVIGLERGQVISLSENGAVVRVGSRKLLIRHSTS